MKLYTVRSYRTEQAMNNNMIAGEWHRNNASQAQTMAESEQGFGMFARIYHPDGHLMSTLKPAYPKKERDVEDTSRTNPVLRTIVVTGNPKDGFKFYGPFIDGEEALKFCENDLDTNDWWITEMEAPK